MSEWKKYKLGEVSQIIGGGTPSTTKEEYWNGKIGWLTPRDLTGYAFKYISKGERSITEEGLKNSSARLMPEGTVLMTSRAPIGYLAIAGDELCTNQGFKSFIVEENKINNVYLYYLLKSNIDRIKSLGTGSTFAEVSASTLKDFEIEIPNIETQTQIAAILSSLDDKIELNLQMNQTLEAMAQAIFKEWFVPSTSSGQRTFNFPGFDGELVDDLPRGWRKLSIGNLFEETIGGDWGKEEFSEEFSELDYVVRGNDFNKILNGNISSVPKRYIKKSNFNKRKIENGNLLLEISGGSKDQPTGRTILFTDELLSLFDFPVVPASFCRLIKPINIDSSMYLDIFLKYFYSIGGTWEYQNQSTGISNFQFTYFASNKTVIVPDNNTMILFSNLIETNTRKICENTIQIQTLTQTRDALLPRLMSGEIKVMIHNG